jgi:hypothetical protein
MQGSDLKPGELNTPHEAEATLRVWEQPTYQRIGAEEAETGIQFGPEILILLS